MTTILQLFPEVLDVNGDAQNALVLAQRASWAGLAAELFPVSLTDRVPDGRPAAVVIGSSVDSALPAIRIALERLGPALRDWKDAGVPILAIGTGLEILGDDGLGLVPGRPDSRPDRAVGDLVVDTEFGRLVGFENHARAYLLPADARALGTIVHGIGNDGRSEGVRSGSVWGTHLHGPVLAKNPALADALLTRAFGADYRAGDPRHGVVDGFATAARSAILARLGIGIGI